MANKIKHLEMILGIINRLNNNSFLIKAWAMGLATALFAFASSDKDKKFILLSCIIIPTCWVLDAFFISTERQFRALYKQVSEIKDDSEVTFSMMRDEAIRKEHTWFKGFISQTLLFFHGILFATALIVICCFN